MPKPLVCAIMLVNGRPEMVKRAVASYQAQTYENKRLLIWNTGPNLSANWPELFELPGTIWTPGVDGPACAGMTVGELRNLANRFASTHYGASSDRPDILAHWDSDDWSHPRRIEEQVALLEQTKADAVGYHDMLFWRDTEIHEGRGHPSEAWLYRHKNLNYCLGTSLCYWREVWQQVKFDAMPIQPGATGEEYNWLKKINAVGASIFHPVDLVTEPRMIASIHGSNTQYYGEDMLKTYTEWQRAESWDSHCRKVMTL